MGIKLILPKSAVHIEPDELIFFLAGPILGGNDWQSNAIRLISQQVKNVYIACPCRYKPDHPLYSLSVAGENVDQWRARGLIGSDHVWLDAFTRQTYWECFYLDLASRQGCIIFWLPEESRTHPRPPEKGPYARDTYGELGEWRGRMIHEKARVVIGAERGFSGLSVIEANYRAKVGERFAIKETLEQTIEAAIALVSEK